MTTALLCALNILNSRFFQYMKHFIRNRSICVTCGCVCTALDTSDSFTLLSTLESERFFYFLTF